MAALQPNVNIETSPFMQVEAFVDPVEYELRAQDAIDRWVLLLSVCLDVCMYVFKKVFKTVSPHNNQEILPIHHQNHRNTVRNMTVFNQSLWKIVIVRQQSVLVYRLNILWQVILLLFFLLPIIASVSFPTMNKFSTIFHQSL